MYKHVIYFYPGTPDETIEELVRLAEKAFSNRVGTLKNISSEKHRLIYEGGDDEYGCLSLGMLTLWKNKKFIAHVFSWTWIDEEEPENNCNVLKELAIPVY